MTFRQAVDVIRERSGDEITGIIAEHVNLKRSGSSLAGLCPFHEEKTPSFRISEQKQIYKCFGCGVGGDAIDFIMKIEGLEFHEAIYMLADRYLIDIQSGTAGRQPGETEADELIIPGIRPKKGDIRKNGSVFIAMNDFGTQKQVDGPKVSLTGPPNDKQAALLGKFCQRCVLIIRDVDWQGVKSAIKTLLRHGFSVYILNPVFIHNKEEEWLDYLLTEVGGFLTQSDIVELLAVIPNDLTRTIYTTYFSTKINKKT